MARNLIPNERLDALADEHGRWLSGFDPRYLANWKTRCRHDYEAAMTEASVRRMLQLNGVTVKPNEKLVGDCGGPDFRCSIAGCRFYVEVTCISIATAERKTGISKEPNPKFTPFNVAGMTEAIFDECINKARQCAGQDAPVLLAIGTFHGFAAMTGFDKVLVNMALTGQTSMAWDVNPHTGQQSDTYNLTEFKRAAFLRPDPTEAVRFARQPISGLLLVKLGSLQTMGVLHPNPVLPFDPSLLANIEFGRVALDRQSARLTVNWSKAIVA